MENVPQETVIKRTNGPPNRRPWHARLARQLKQGYAARREHSHKLNDIAAAVAGRHVLERDAGIDEIEMPVRKDAQIAFLVHHVLAAAAVLVVIIGLLDHGSGNIHAIDVLEMPGQGLGQPPDATSEIERSPLP